MPPTFVKGFHDPEEIKKLKYTKLGETDMKVSNLSLGTAAFGALAEKDEGVVAEILKKALQSGINFIDTAPWYGMGKSEVVLGNALKRLRVQRKAFYIATKVGRYETEVDKMFNFTSERTLQSVDESLKRLGVKYIDLVQLHDVEFCASNQQLLQHTIPALLKLKKMGKIKYIGVTGYPLDLLKDLVKQTDPGVIAAVQSYCRATLFDKELIDEVAFFQEHSVGIIHASPLGLGLLTERGAPTWHPATNKLQDACHSAALFCKKGGVDLAKLATVWSMRQEGIASTLISAASISGLEFNLEAAAATLTEEEEKVLTEIEDKCFKTLKATDRNWIKVEVVRYWVSMKAQEADQPMD